MFEGFRGIVGLATGSEAERGDESPSEEEVGESPLDAALGESPADERVGGSPASGGADGTITAESVVRSVLDGLCYPIFTVDAGGNIDRINDEALDLFEKTREDLIGVCLFDLDEADNTVMREVLDTGEPVQNREDTIVVESGEIPVSRSLMPIYDDAEDIVGALEINRDISERVELRRREELLESYQETVIEELRASLAGLSEGHLTVEPTVSEPPERFEAIDNVYRKFDGMATDLGTAVESLRDALRRTRVQSGELASIGAELRTATAEANGAIVDINDSSDDVAASAERQADRAARAEENVSNLSASVEEITATVQRIDDRSDDAADRARAGTATAYDAIETIDEASAASERNIGMIESLEARMATIDGLTRMIADIADQTNLLALNANIEAARVDGDGAGFQVVANEVKELAEESKGAVEEIAESLEALKSGVAETADTIEESNRQVETGVDAVRTVVDHIEDIETAVEETNEGVEEIRDATVDQAENASEVSELVEGVSRASGDVSAEIQEIAAGIDQQTDAVGEVADASEEVSDVSDAMQEMLDEFRLESEAMRSP